MRLIVFPATYLLTRKMLHVILARSGQLRRQMTLCLGMSCRTCTLLIFVFALECFNSIFCTCIIYSFASLLFITLVDNELFFSGRDGLLPILLLLALFPP